MLIASNRNRAIHSSQMSVEWCACAVWPSGRVSRDGCRHVWRGCVTVGDSMETVRRRATVRDLCCIVGGGTLDARLMHCLLLAPHLELALHSSSSGWVWSSYCILNSLLQFRLKTFSISIAWFCNFKMSVYRFKMSVKSVKKFISRRLRPLCTFCG